MRRKRGFTLIEILVVVAIFAALMAMGGMAFITAMKRSRNARRAADIQEIRTALEMYRTDKGYYPRDIVAGDSCDASISAGYVTPVCSASTLGASWPTNNNGVSEQLEDNEYMADGTMPKDPLNTTLYYYSYVVADGCGISSNPKCMDYELQYFEEPLTGLTPTPKVVRSP